MLPADLSTLASLCRGSLDVAAGGGIAVAMLLAGLAAGATHCSVMCGPLVLAQVGFLPAPKCAYARVIAGARTPFHLGRALTYVVLGGLAGGVGRGIVRWAAAVPSSALLLAAGTVILAILMIMPQGAWRKPFVPSWVAAATGPLFRDGWRYGIVLGMLLGLLPCGLVYGALAVAAASGSAVSGALAMLAFAAGTTPALMSIGIIGRSIGPRLSARWRMAPLAINVTIVALLALRAWL